MLLTNYTFWNLKTVAGVWLILTMIKPDRYHGKLKNSKTVIY